MLRPPSVSPRRTKLVSGRTVAREWLMHVWWCVNRNQTPFDMFNAPLPKFFHHSLHVTHTPLPHLPPISLSRVGSRCVQRSRTRRAPRRATKWKRRSGESGLTSGFTPRSKEEKQQSRGNHTVSLCCARIVFHPEHMLLFTAHIIIAPFFVM